MRWKRAQVGAFNTPASAARAVQASVTKQPQAVGKAIVSAGTSVQMLRCSDGAHVRTIGSQGSGNGQFSSLIGVAVDGDGRVVVCEYGKHRVQVLE